MRTFVIVQSSLGIENQLQKKLKKYIEYMKYIIIYSDARHMQH